MKHRIKSILGPVLGLALFAAALWVLHKQLGTYRYHDIVLAVHQLPAAAVWAALALTAFNYLLLTGYDYLALRFIGRSLPYPNVALASFVSYAFSQGLGFPLLTGAPARLRLYSQWGLSAVEIAQVIALSTLTFLLGLFVTAGVMFTVHTMPLPPMLGMHVKSTLPLGVALLAGVGGYLAMNAWRQRPLRIGGWEFPVPPTKLTLIQIAISSIEWATAAAVLAVLIAPFSNIPFLTVLQVFLLAQLAGIISQVPGGLGVFEAVVLVLLPEKLPQDGALAALLVYRAVYYLLPLTIALIGFGLFEVGQRREKITRFRQLVAQWVSPVAPIVVSAGIFIAGVVLLISGALPRMPARIRTLNDFLPLSVIEASHFLASSIGVALLVLSYGLRRRLDSAYHITVALLVAGIAFSLLKGLDYEEASVLVGMLLVLVASRREFYRQPSVLSEPLSPAAIALVLLVVTSSLFIGMFAFKHVPYTDAIWGRVQLLGDAPRFLRATAGAFVTSIVAVIALRWFRVAPEDVTEPTLESMPRIDTVIGNARDTRAHLALLRDKHLLFSDSGSSFLMYGVEGRSWVTMGDPMGLAEERDELAWKFREMVDRHDGWPVFYQVRPENLALYLDLGLTMLKLGEEARVPLREFSLEGSSRKRLRQTMKRFEKIGASFEVLPPDAVPPLLPELRRISDDWLQHKAGAEKKFSLGFFDEEYLLRTPLAIIRVDCVICAFANLWCGGDREELTVDLMRYPEDAPDNVMEYLFIEMMLWGREQGYGWFNMGMAPLSGIENRRLAPLWNRLAGLAYRYGENFYSFQGLRSYKEKFDPVWEPRYLASRGGMVLPRILTNVAALVSGGTKNVLFR
ncbi:MAG: bifunctional lysylphosphatidylglycerol flippase/synthetase MprF [Longimicrobiales bacterium]